MAAAGKEKDFINQGDEAKELRKYSLKQWITGSVLAKSDVRKQLPFVIFLAMLGFVYIANRYHAEALMRETMKLQQDIDELRAESVTTAASLMFACRQSVVQKMIEKNGLGLQEATAPPKRIKMRD